MTNETSDESARTYKIPEIREPTLFDFIAKNFVPEIFRFAEYVTVSGFAFYLAIKTNALGLYAFAILLYAGTYWYVMDKHIAFIKVLEFRNVWVMRVTSWLLVIVGLVAITYVQWLVIRIASIQVGGK